MAAFLRNTLPTSLTAIGWALLSLTLLLAGDRHGEPESPRSGLYPRRGHVLPCLVDQPAVRRHFRANPDHRRRHRDLLCSGVSDAQAARRLKGSSSGLEGAARLVYSWLATLLLALLLFHEVSGSLLTVAWGIQVSCSLLAGFPLRERCLRHAGLALLVTCVLRLFFYDLRQLELPSAYSFLVLGVILIGVSFVYSRYRERISRYFFLNARRPAAGGMARVAADLRAWEETLFSIDGFEFAFCLGGRENRSPAVLAMAF